MNLEKINRVEIVNLKGRKAIEVRLQREIGQRKFNAFAKFVGGQTDFIAAWHSVNPEEAKNVAIQKLLEQEEMNEFL